MLIKFILPSARCTLLLAVLVAQYSGLSRATPYPAEYWARRPAISHVSLSPDGASLALLRISKKGANPVIEVYPTDDLKAVPFRVNADPMEIVEIKWVDDSNLIFLARQQVREMIDGFNEGVYEFRIALVDLEARKIHGFNERDPSLVSTLPNKKNKILISFAEGTSGGVGAKLQEAFRPRAYWEFDLKTGSKKLLIRGKLLLGNIDFDRDGNPALARGFDLASREYLWFWRPENSGEWKEFYRQSEDAFEEFRVFGLDPQVPGNLIVEANRNANTSGLWSFDPDTREFSELLYHRNDVDICGVRYHSNEWEHPNLVSGVMHCKEKPTTEYFDSSEQALHAHIESLIPHAYYLRVAGRSRDGQTLVIRNSGPNDPGTHYLLHEGTLQLIGAERPWLDSDNLANVHYVTYAARDGEVIPAFVTVPEGNPPFPMVVMPHGGPFVRETVIFDEWAQMLANKGFLVLQPQYRGSKGYGQRFYQIAFSKGGQGGYKMQDDKDDGVAWAVAEGLASSDRVAMFGWSYGGYAALVAASRTPQIYQCVIAGAAVTDPEMQVNYYRYRLRGRSKVEQLRMWDDSVSPINEVEQVNVPILLIHGTVDQRVPLEHAKKYRRALLKAEKDHTYLELNGADHFSNTLFFDHKLSLYESIFDYLLGDCGIETATSAQDQRGASAKDPADL